MAQLGIGRAILALCQLKAFLDCNQLGHSKTKQLYDKVVFQTWLEINIAFKFEWKTNKLMQKYTEDKIEPNAW